MTNTPKSDQARTQVQLLMKADAILQLHIPQSAASLVLVREAQDVHDEHCRQTHEATRRDRRLAAAILTRHRHELVLEGVREQILHRDGGRAARKQLNAEIAERLAPDRRVFALVAV